jgi:hypothetical protein
MRAPLSWIKEFVDIPSSVTAEQISDGLIRVGFEVEEIIKQGADLTFTLPTSINVELRLSCFSISMTAGKWDVGIARMTSSGSVSAPPPTKSLAKD